MKKIIGNNITMGNKLNFIKSISEKLPKNKANLFLSE